MEGAGGEGRGRKGRRASTVGEARREGGISDAYQDGARAGRAGRGAELGASGAHRAWLGVEGGKDGGCHK